MHLTLSRDGAGWRFTARYGCRSRDGTYPTRRQALDARLWAMYELMGS